MEEDVVSGILPSDKSPVGEDGRPAGGQERLIPSRIGQGGALKASHMKAIPALYGAMPV